MKIRAIQLCLLYFFSFITVINSAGQYRFDAWTIDDGLPQNSIRDIEQTRDGYIWLATHDGLVRFDGVRFTVFNRSTHSNLMTTRFRVLFEAEDGSLWVGTEKNGVSRFYHNKFENYSENDGLPSGTVSEIYAESDGRIAVATSQGTAYWQNGKFSVPENNLPETEQYIYYNALKNTRWIFERPNVLKKETSLSKEIITLPFTIEYMFQVKALEDSNGVLWIAERNGLWHFSGGEFKKIQDVKDFQGNIICFMEDRDKNVWIGTSGQGLYRYRENSFAHLTQEDGLSADYIRALFQDREGTIWIGTDNRGLNRMQQQLIRPFSTKHGLIGVNVYPIFPDSKGRVWIGTQDNALNMLENGQLRKFEFYGVRTITEDKSGKIWIVGQDDLRVFEDNQLKSINSEIPVDLASNFIHAVQLDRQGTIWFSSDVGLFRFENGEWTRFNKSGGFPTNETRFIYETRQGEFYVGTYDGLVKFNPRSPQDGVEFIDASNGLKSNHLRAIHEDSEGSLWLGTYDGGLTRLKDGKLTNFTTADGLFSDGVFNILDDDRGNFWMSSNQGIHRVSKKELDDFAEGRIKKLNGIGYGKRDGMLNAECNGDRYPSGAKMPDGTLWFPTQDGVAIVNPKLLTFNPLPPPVIIENVLINHEQADLSNEIRAGENQDNLEIQFTALSFIRSEQIRFRYQLEGLNNEWIDLGTRRYANFSYLPAGQYRFRVTAANSDGVWNENGASIEITVVPPFYRTWWFWTLAAFGIAGIAFLFYRNRVRQLQREKTLADNFSRTLIESQERERKRIAAELHDGLSQSLVIIKNRATLSLDEPHNTERAFEQLEEISQAATEAIDEAKEIIYDLRPIQLDRLGLTKAIAAMIRRMAETNEIEFQTAIEPIDDLFAKEAESSVYRILQESVNNIVRHSQATKAEIKISKNEHSIRIFIKDNGCGFTKNENKKATGGFGLVGIQERARLLHGEALIESELNKGTVIKIKLPISR